MSALARHAHRRPEGPLTCGKLSGELAPGAEQVQAPAGIADRHEPGPAAAPLLAEGGGGGGDRVRPHGGQ